MSSLARAALCLLLASHAISQTTATVEVSGIPIKIGAMGDDENSVRWKFLTKNKGIDSERKLREAARENLIAAKKLSYELQRVEVAGMLATDEVDEPHSDMFNQRLKLSNLNEARESRGHIRDALDSIFNAGKDAAEALSDTRGNPTTRSKTIIGALKGKRINEIYAHSWGTEAVYLGILSGEIIPPNKLIIVGVPEANEEKWLMLAKYTGIEVHVVGFDWDKAKLAGDLAVKLKSGLPQDSASLEKLWNSRCAGRGWRGCADPKKFIRTKFDYDIAVHPPDAPKDEFFRMHLSKLDHDRMLYYRHLYNRNLFNKTADQLDAPQLKLIEAEENRILDDALRDARMLITSAKNQLHIQQRDHDERLKRTLAELAVRSCSIPGSVSQTELNSLPKPHDPDYLAVMPDGLGECGGQIYIYLRVGANAEFIKNASMVRVPQPIEQPPRAVPAAPSIPPAFSDILPRLREFAVAACRAPEQVLIEPYAFRFGRSDRNRDDLIAAQLAGGLDACSSRVFHQLIGTIRDGDYGRIDREWIRSRVAAASRQPGASLEYESPRGRTGRGGRCEDYGNINCP